MTGSCNMDMRPLAGLYVECLVFCTVWHSPWSANQSNQNAGAISQ